MTNTLLGTWKLNVDKSTADPGPLVRSETRGYEAVGDDGLKLVVRGSDASEAAYSYSVTGKIDGRDYPLAGSRTRNGADSTSWKRIDPERIGNSTGCPLRLEAARCLPKPSAGKAMPGRRGDAGGRGGWKVQALSSQS